MSGGDKSVDLLAQLLQDTKLPDGVSFAGKGLKLDSAEDAQQVVDAIQACSSLEFLNLEGNTIGVEAAIAISRALEKHSELKRALWKDMFTGRLKEEIPKALKALCDGVMKAKAKLEVLDLSDNASGYVGVNGISDFIKSPCCYTLKELRLNNMGLGITGAQMLSNALLDCCRRAEKDGNPLKLKVFIAGRNRLENEGTKALSQVFKKIESLEELSIPQNGIYHVGIKALADALSCNTHLKKLNLNDNSPGKIGAKALAEGLRNVHKLTSLDLGDCLVKTSGALAIAEMLMFADSIEEVVLSFNSIRIEGGLAILEALVSKKNLSSLKLDGNKFGEKGIETLRRKVIELGKPLEILDSLEEDEGSEDDDDDVDYESGEEEEENEDYDEDESESLYGDEDEGEEEISAEEEVDDDDDDEEERVEPLKNLEITNNHEKLSRKLSDEREETNPVEKFIADPTIENLMILGKNPAGRIIEEVKKKNHDITARIEELISVAMSISSLRDTAKADSINKLHMTHEYRFLLECVHSLYAELFSLALRCNCLSTVNNALPVSLGLIKGENKKSKVFNQENCITTLKEAMKKEYFPKETSELLEFIMSNKPPSQRKIQKGN